MEATQDLKKPRFYAGFYLRTKNRARFWGWGDPPAQAMERRAEQPWSQLADWLRMVHSSTQSGILTQPEIPVSSSHEQKTESTQAANGNSALFVINDFLGL